MINLFRTATILTSVAFLAACGGSSTSTNAPITIDEVNDFYADFSVFLDALGDSELAFLPTNDLIAQGSANYSGFATIVPNDTFNNIIGRTEISADFTDGGSLSGRITDMSQVVESEAVAIVDPITGDETVDAPLVAVDGTLTLSNGNIQEEAILNEIDIDVAGSIVIPARTSLSQQDETFDIGGSISGSVTEDQDLFAFGLLDGTSSGTTVPFETLIFANPDN